jgi:hypothetical protein
MVERCEWLTNDKTFAALQFLGNIDLVARRVLHKLNIGDLVSNLDKGWGSRVEKAAASDRTH